MVGVDEIHLAEIVGQGRIPIVHVVTNRKTNKPTLRLKAAPSFNEYVAVSHVWADGLGNPLSNSLPECQVKRLNRQISALSKGKRKETLVDEVFEAYLNAPERVSFTAHWVPATSRDTEKTSSYLWIDTLCVPVGKSKESLRIQAINKMASVYVGASHVLVLDYELQQLRLDTQPLADHMASIISCNWSSRNWTYQEGTLSTRCYFQYADGAVNPNVQFVSFEKSRLFERMKSSREFSGMWRAPHVSELYVALMGLLLFLPAWSFPDMIPPDAKASTNVSWTQQTLRQGLGRSIDQLLSVNSPRRRSFSALTNEVYYSALVGTWNALIHRSTTKADDLYAILCNLADFQSHELMKLESNSKIMAAILSSSPAIPLSFFYNRGPRYLENEDHRDRWLPAAVKGSHLSHRPLLNVKEDCLYVNANDTGLKPIILLPPTKLDGTCTLVTRDKLPICNVEVHRSNDDRFRVDRSRYVATGILLEKDIRVYHGQIRGACVHVTSVEDESSDNPIGLSVVYDCPITATQFFWAKAGTSGSDSLREVCIDRVIEEYSLEVKREPLLFAGRLPRREYLRAPSGNMWLFPCLDYLTASYMSYTVVSRLLRRPEQLGLAVLCFLVGVNFVFAGLLDLSLVILVACFPSRLLLGRQEVLAMLASKYIFLTIYTTYDCLRHKLSEDAWVASF
ncbi:hypothetical protein F5Y05DRAFT_373862 [Hypoxylon sp. FL0543]|nr:hypothetical protein F5Y05DRAFT_373862 [Hypoxylon sp. FL0543]